MFIDRLRELLGERRADRLGVRCNVGPNERYLRLGIAVLAGLAAVSSARGKKWRIPLALMSASGLFTSLTRYCPLNTLLGFRNCAGGQALRGEAQGRIGTRRAAPARSRRSRQKVAVPV